MGTSGDLPGCEFVEPGLRDLRAGVRSDAAFAVMAAAPRLRRAGIDVPFSSGETDASHELYASLGRQFGTRAHGRHHAMLRRVASYAAAHARARGR